MTALALAICLVTSFLFSGTEAGILSLNRVRLRHRLKLNDPAARKLQRLVSHPERMLVTVLLVTNLMNICAILLITRACVRAWGAPGYLVAGAICLPLCQFCLELLPKSLFRRFPYRSLAALSDVLRLADLLLSPVLALGGLILRLAPRKPEERKLFAAREDFKYLTIESERQGTLLPVEREMIHNVMDLGSAKARDVMVPRDRAGASRPISPDRPGTLPPHRPARQFRGACERLRGADRGREKAGRLRLPAPDRHCNAWGRGLQHYEKDACRARYTGCRDGGGEAGGGGEL